jgi:D-glycero-alpha-D-manno-heptose 1-phosphate guanylyltransferase
LTAFEEKAPGAGLINAGVYVLRRRLLAGAPRGAALSMETQFLPSLLRDGARIQVLAMNAPFIDIGTPETVDEATAFIERHFCQGAAA